MRLIDADALKEAIKSDMYVVDYADEGAIYGMFWSGIENAIDEQPTVEPTTGKWMFSSNDAEGVCSCCNFKLYGTPYYGKYLIVPYNYCPNCGCKMEVDDE